MCDDRAGPSGGCTEPSATSPGSSADNFFTTASSATGSQTSPSQVCGTEAEPFTQASSSQESDDSSIQVVSCSHTSPSHDHRPAVPPDAQCLDRTFSRRHLDRSSLRFCARHSFCPDHQPDTRPFANPGSRDGFCVHPSSPWTDQRIQVQKDALRPLGFNPVHFPGGIGSTLPRTALQG